MTRESTQRTVLYVEDEEGDAFFMRWAFDRPETGTRLALRRVEDGRAAIQYLSGLKDYEDREAFPIPDLVLLDLHLPEVHGFDVLKWMRAQPQYAAIPVVIFSSSNREEDRATARELGATDFWEKPNSGLRFGAIVDQLRQSLS